jgi:hypothetical protein
MTPVYLLAAFLLANPPPDGRAFSGLTPHMRIRSVRLMQTTFKDARRQLGPAEIVHNGGDAAASAYAACYVGPDGTTLALISVSEMGEQGKIITDYQLVAKEADVDFSGDRGTPWPRDLHPRRPRCLETTSVSKLTRDEAGLRLGMSEREVIRLLGRPTRQSANSMTWIARREEPYEERSIEVNVAKGVVTGIFAHAAPF